MAHFLHSQNLVHSRLFLVQQIHRGERIFELVNAFLLVVNIDQW